MAGSSSLRSSSPMQMDNRTVYGAEIALLVARRLLSLLVEELGLQTIGSEASFYHLYKRQAKARSSLANALLVASPRRWESSLLEYEILTDTL